MIKNILCFLLFISISSVFSQNDLQIKDSLLATVSDGPYIFIEKNKLVEKSIINGKVSSKILNSKAYDTLFTPETGTFKNVKKIAAISDIHGQYDLAIKILINNKIIDKNLNWSFGKGHLVIVGDVFNRGDKANEMLWLLYKLETQAKKKGGHVHFLLGNHEYMILHHDLRYIHEKYRISAKLLNLNYDDLFSNNTVIGKWLRSKSTIIKINNNIFVHGGISKEFLSENDFNIDKINAIMRKSIEKTKTAMKSTDFYSTYYGSNSLIWYRGYFKDSSLKDSDISKILKQVKTDHIVVGHCSNDEVVQLFNHKIFGVDSSIKRGKYGEVLFIENNKFFRGTLDGEKIQFHKTKIPQKINN